MTDDRTVGPIDEWQMAYLLELLSKSNRTEAQFLRYMRVDSIDQIAYKDYLKAVGALLRVRESK